MKKDKTFISSVKHLDLIPYRKSDRSIKMIINNNYNNTNSNNHSSSNMLTSKFPPLCKSKTKSNIDIISIPKRRETSFSSYSILKSLNNNNKNRKDDSSQQLYLNVSSDLLTQDTLSLPIKRMIQQITQPTFSINPIQISEPNKGREVKPIKKAETGKQFLLKTHELVRLKYTSKIKGERIERLKETYENDIETINDRMHAIKEAKDLFAVTFCNKFNQYIKDLIMQRNGEKVELKRIRSEKVKAENDYMGIQYKIRLKERELVKKEKWYLLQKVFNDKQTPKNKLNPYFNGNNDHISNKNTEIELFFKTPEEFITELKKYEMYNLLLLNKFNDINIDIREYQIQQNIQLLETNNEVMQLISLKDQKKIELQQLKAKYIELQKEKQTKLGVKTNNLEMITSPKLYHILLSIYQSICNSSSMYLNQLRLKSPVDTISILSLLAFIERTADFFIDKNSRYFLHSTLHNAKIYQVAKKKALKDRQAVLSMKIAVDNINKTTQLVDKVNKKINQVYFIPFRKVDKYYYKNVHKEKKMKKAVNKTDDIVDINDLLHDIITE